MPESNEPKPFDVFADDFNIEIGPYGAVVSLRTTMATPQPVLHGRLRMSTEHMKVLAFRMHQLIRQVETKQKIEWPISVETLSLIRIKEEDWTLFWKG